MIWIIRPIMLFAAFSLVWELIQLPFYSIWNTGTVAEISYAVLHCTAGDVLIGIVIWLLSRLIIKVWKQELDSGLYLPVCFILLALAYTVFSEWWNVNFIRSWAYTDAMPLLPPFGTGLTPLLQWIIVPILTWISAGETIRARLAGRLIAPEGTAL